MEYTTGENSKITVNIQSLVGKLKQLKENAYQERKKREKQKYEEKKRRERERYHEKKKKTNMVNPKTQEAEFVPKPPEAEFVPKPQEAEFVPAKKNKERIQVYKNATKEKKSKPTKSVEERRKYERDRKRKQRENIKKNKERHEALNKIARERYHTNKAEGKIKNICDLNPRLQRSLRKRWKINQRRHRESVKRAQKLREYVEENSPPPTPEPVSEPEINMHYPQQNQNVLRRVQNSEGSKKKNKKNKVYKDLARTKNQLVVEKRKAERFKKKYQRLLKLKTSIKSTSPNTKVTDIIQRRDVKEVKRRLLFGEVLQQQITKNVKNMKTQREKQIAAAVVGGENFKKYRLTKYVKNIVSSHNYKKAKNVKNLNPNRKKKLCEKMEKIKRDVQLFFDDDLNTTQAPGKKDCVTLKKKTMQKRYLRDTLSRLHLKFNESHSYKLSFTTFYRLKPFWILKPDVNRRNTCLCVKHANFNLMLKRMHSLKLLNHANIENIRHDFCCKSTNEKCIYRNCETCSEKEFNIDQSQCKTSKTFLEKWDTTYENRIGKDRNEIKVKVTTKIVEECSVEELIDKFKKAINIVLPHDYRAYHQQQFVKKIKQNLTKNEAIINIDFSENYICKYNEEVQSVHFGGSKKQISLHTGAMYFVNNGIVDCFSFCGLSDDILHNACSVWAYLKPIIMQALDKNINTLHIISDGPTSQYKNKTNFFLICKYAEFFKLKRLTWNFYEPGHGKSVADGIGGAIKRQADAAVAHGEDITSSRGLIESLKQKETRVYLYEIKTCEINDVKQYLEQFEEIKSVLNTMKIRQIIWNSSDKDLIKIKYLSCFQCQDECSHYMLKPNTHSFNQVSKENEKPGSSRDMENTEYGHNHAENEPEDQHFTNFKIGNFLLVKFLGKKKYSFFVGQIIELSSEISEEKYLVKFLKYSFGKFFWPENEDISYIMANDIVQKLGNPIVDRRQNLIFDFDFNKYKM